MSLPVRQSPIGLLPLPTSGGMVARVSQGLRGAPRAVSGLPGSALRMSIKLRASVAEFLLVSRLRARGLRAPSGEQSEDVIRQGAHVLDVTCKNWFAEAGRTFAST